MSKCYQFDSQGYFLFEASDHNQSLPMNATYIEPPEEKEGFRRKFVNESWEYEEVEDTEDIDPYILSKEEKLNLLESWYNEEIARLGRDKLEIELEDNSDDRMAEIQARHKEIKAAYAEKKAEIEATS